MSFESIKSFEQEGKEKAAEIARLKALITELADALDEYVHTPTGEKLIQRAREATR